MEEPDSLSLDRELAVLKREIYKIHGRVYYLSASVFVLVVTTIFLIFQVYWGNGFFGLAATLIFLLPFYVFGLYIIFEMRKEAKKTLQ